VAAWPSRCTSRMHSVALCLSLQRDYLTQSSNTRALSQLSLRVLFITAITFGMNNDDGSDHLMYLSALNMRSDWFLLVLITF